MDIRVLGPFGVFRDGEPLKVSPAKMSGLYVASLAMTVELRASHTYVAQRLWPGESVDNMGGRLRQYVAELRRTAPELVPIRMGSQQCSLAVPREAVDYLRFWDLLRIARGQGAAEKIATLQAALDEWSGDPVEDITSTGFDADRARLVGEWQSAWILYLSALLETGRAMEALEETREPLDRWPDNERLFKVKLDVLQTLGGFTAVRDAMTEWESFGKKPSTDLTAHCRNLLGVVHGPTRPSRPAVPHQLPAHRPTLVGRAAEYAALDRLLLDDVPSGSRLVVLNGMPGVGKSALILSWAHKVDAHFEDGCLHFDLNGHAATEPAPTEQVLAHFLNRLKVDPSTPSPDGMIEAYRSTVASLNILVVLDNARNAEQVRPLLPGPGTCAVIVSSRNRLDSLVAYEGAQVMKIDRLSRNDSLRLLAEEGAFTLSANAAVGDDLADFCGDLPLALVIVGALVRNRDFGDLWQTRNALRGIATRLANLQVAGCEDLNIEAAFTASYRALSGEAQRLLWHLAIHPGPTVSRAAIYVLEDRIANEPRLPALEELQAAHLLEEPHNQRYKLHDLTRRFAERRADAQPDDECRKVAVKVFDFLMHNSWSCDRVLVPGRILPIDLPSGSAHVAPSGIAEAMAWFAAEYETILQAIDRAAEMDMHRHTWLLAMALVTYQWRANKYADAAKTLGLAAEAAKEVAASGERAMVERMLGGTYRGMGNRQTAKWHAKRAVGFAQEAGDLRATVLSQNALAILCRETGDLIEARMLFSGTLPSFRQLGDPLGEAVALNGLGCIHLSHGEHEEALSHCDAAVRLFATTSDINGHANALVNRGRTRFARGEYNSAAADLAAALAGYQKLSYPRNEANTLLEFADSLVALQRTDEAREMLMRAESLFNELRESTDEVADRIRRLG
ncbi:hypothetical protein Aple_095420 [Acrocarpospora pleiomorpha]|uniref:Bacterial transcriptional activator domain-containing protein n=2 Tax=Acrocarpospora pleiomorpha TaxID=90975 RepID=A0A5M3Y3P7_9ACTN|nr:hypothetical protein Aple_095420 [Acrocarpospora pleiomorpha]